jgi:hypothetical protein
MSELDGGCDHVHSVIEGDEPVWPRPRLDRSVRGEEDETVSKTTDLISTFERWLISLFIRVIRAAREPTSAKDSIVIARVFHPSAELLSRPRCPGQPHFRTVHRDQLGHYSDRPDQANRDHGGHCHHPCAHLLPLCIAFSLAKQGLAHFLPLLCEAVHSLERHDRKNQLAK